MSKRRNTDGLEPPLETAITETIQDWAHYRPDLTVWRLNTGVAWLPGKGGKERPVSFGLKGQPDLIGFLAPWGVFIGIEVKRPGRWASPLTDEQRAMGEAIRRAGGIWFIATSVDDAIKGVEDARRELAARTRGSPP